MGNQGSVGTGIFYEFDSKKAEEILDNLIKDKEVSRRIGRNGNKQIILSNGESFILRKCSDSSRGHRFERLYISKSIPPNMANWLLIPYVINDGSVEFFEE